MRLTSEEHQKLRSNLQKIEDYIVSEICPHMCGTSVTVDFGEEKTYYGDKNGIENKYHITVTDKSVSGRTGYLGLAIVKKDNDSGSSFDTYVEAGMALLREWPRIKEALRAHLVKVSLNKSVLDTFAV